VEPGDLRRADAHVQKPGSAGPAQHPRLPVLQRRLRYGAAAGVRVGYVAELLRLRKTWGTK
jgi:hypothetical protein